MINCSNLKASFQGAESRLYEYNFLGIPCYIKERFEKKYRVPELDIKISKMSTRTEARCLAKSRKYGLKVPAIIYLELPRIIIMEKIEGKELSVVISDNSERNKMYATKLGVFFNVLHNEIDIVHGDFTSANVIIDKNDDVHLIDFGLGSMQASIESKAMDLYCFQRSLLCKHSNVAEKIFSDFLTTYSQQSSASKAVVKNLAILQKKGRKRELEA